MKKYFPIVILLGCAAALVFGLTELFELRFEVGDVYAPYSSLRSDPLGSMALYESLSRVDGVQVRRDFSTDNHLPEEPHTVYLHLAAYRYEWNYVPADLFRELDSYLARGNRLVITFFPVTTSYSFRADDEDETNSVKTAPAPAPAKKDKEKENPRHNKRMADRKKIKEKADDPDRFEDLTERWGFGIDFRKLERDGDSYEPVEVVNRTDLPLPRTLQWHSGMVFTNSGAAWHVIYARGANAVVMERQFGKGSVVLASDSFFVSNEALEKDRHADLLAWLIGPSERVVFDEAHLGVVETSGVAALMRQYRLHGLIAGLICLAGLFIWKNSTSLVPAQASQQRQDYVAGKDSTTGFVNLLRRNIAPRTLLSLCYSEWKKSGGTTGLSSTARRQQAEALFQAETSRPAHDRNDVEIYRRICSVLATRNELPKS